MLCTYLKPKDPVHQKGPVLSSKINFEKIKVFSHKVHPLLGLKEIIMEWMDSAMVTRLWSGWIA